jgi:pyruvate dehydrogenase E2 component (dihydrolipoamide acetyltransferase)
MYKVFLNDKSPGQGDAVVAEWLKQEGQALAEGEAIVRVETADSLLELKAAVAGTLLKVCVTPGMLARANQALCYIGQPGEALPQDTDGEPAPEETPAVPAQPPAQKTTGEAMSSDKKTNSNAAGTVIPILMPQAGQSMEEGTILAWKVKEGDPIEVGQVLLEIETDKATMDVEAVDAGRLAKIVAQEGEIVECKVPIAYLGDKDSDVDAFIAVQGSDGSPAAAPATAAAPTQASVQTQPSAASVSSSGRVKASPAARKLAQAKGINLNTLSQGSGPGGRIIMTDVEQAKATPKKSVAGGLSKMRRAIARNLLYSKQNIPHFYAKTTVDAQALFDTYRQVKISQFKCTLNDFVVAACAKAVREFEPFRGQFQENETIKVLPNVNIGIAVGTDEGLTVPVVLKVDTLPLQTVAESIRQVVEEARNGKMANVGQGVFTISNLGMFGVEDFQAIINPPESAILAVGAVREGIKVENGAIKPTRLMAMTVSVDHRVIDGVVAAQFLARVKEMLEAPESLL